MRIFYEFLMNIRVFAELMLLGFISLLLTVFQSTIVKICVSRHIIEHLLPCPLSGKPGEETSSQPKPETTSHFRHLLEKSGNEGYCAEKVITICICLYH